MSYFLPQRVRGNSAGVCQSQNGTSGEFAGDFLVDASEIRLTLRLVDYLIYLIIYKLLFIPGGCLAGFLNHQQ